MASSLAAQLAQVAAKSTSPLDLKAQRVAHSKSLIFEYRVAKSQDFDTLYQLCNDAFQELCRLDTRFTEFERTIFSLHSKSEDRTEMTAAQNKELDVALESFMALVGGKLQLTPAVKALEWLVRRFRVHEFNIAFLILTLLPYHSLPIFLNLLDILPEDLTPTFNFLQPYKKNRVNPPMEAMIRTAAKTPSFSSALNNYTLQVSKQRAHYHGLLAFWSGVMTQACSEMLVAGRAGRREVEKKNHEDIFIRLLPVLNDGLALKKISELVIGCYMIIVVFVTKAALTEDVIDTLMTAVAGSWTQETVNSAAVTLAVLAEQKTNPALPKKVVRSIMKLDNPINLLADVASQHRVSQLSLGLIAGFLGSLQMDDSRQHLTFISQLFQRGLLDEPASKKAINMLFQTAMDAQKSGTLSLDVQTQMSELVQTLNASDVYRPLLQGITTERDMDIDSLEHSLQTTIRTQPALPASEDAEMMDIEEEQEVDNFTPLLESLAKEPLASSSFLSIETSRNFEQTLQAFTLAGTSSDKLQQLSNLPLLGKSEMVQKPQYLSFLVRIFSGPYGIRTRIAAMELISAALVADHPSADLQALLPYIIAALADSSHAMRSEAAKLFSNLVQVQRQAKKEGDGVAPWAKDSLYKDIKEIQPVWLSTSDAQKIIERVLLDGLEGFVHDSCHVISTIQKALKSSGSDSDQASGAELKKGLRQNLLQFLCYHIVATPITQVKLSLLKIVNGVDKIASLTRTKLLTPLITSWQALTESQVAQICDKEHISLPELEQEIATVISPKDPDAERIAFTIVENSARPSLISAVFTRMEQIWIKLGEERQNASAQRLFDLSFRGSEAVQNNAKETLRNVSLSGSVLVDFLDRISEFVSALESHSPSPKRRRTSKNNLVAAISNSSELDEVMGKVTFILELVDTSVPEEHPELTPGLFKSLAALHHLKTRIQSSLGYLLSLVLGSLLAIVNKAKKSSKPSFDTSAIRTDLVVDCVRSSESPQVQNTALLLVSGLAVIAPEQVLHSVMPIFTFMGSSVLKKDDDYSVMVIDQTIDQVVPVLVQSLRNQKRDVVAGTSELLLSFTAAFEHIPSHRRQRLFQALVTKLGAKDFLFAVLAMLSNLYGLDKNVSVLMTHLISGLGPQDQLITYQKYLNLVSDCLKPKPGISQILLGVGNEGTKDKHVIAESLLRSLSHCLKHSSLKAQMAVVFTSDAEETVTKVAGLFSQILEQILVLIDAVQEIKPLSNACSEALGSVLGVLSLVDLLDTVEQLLQRPNPDLRRKVLRLLEARLRQQPEREGAAQNRVLEFISFLNQIVETSDDILLKHAAIACIDRIAEKYGRKNPGMVLPAATVISSDSCLGQEDNRVRVMALLCLASMAEVLGEGVIPALPEMLKKSLALLESSMEGETVNEQLHNAVYSLLSALLIQVPFMLSGKTLDTILRLSFKSAQLELSDEGEEARHDTMKLIAKKFDVKESYGAIERNWTIATTSGPVATKEALETVSLAIEKHPKLATAKNVRILLKLLYRAFDLRREQLPSESDSQFEETQLQAIEELVSNVAIKMIFKLNDTIFRPLFMEIVEWATNGVSTTDDKGRVLRLTSFYKFLQKFFGTLKSIVTSYSSYIIENVIEVLEFSRPNVKGSKDLWLAAVRTLNAAFEHDQDAFWQSPSHFSGISKALISQLPRATNSSTATVIIDEVVPALSELAVATDSPDNYKEMNTALMKYLRPSTSTTTEGGDSAYTRLAALKAEQALTGRLGEEWLTLLPEMLPYISELMEDEDEMVERETRKWVKGIEDILGEKLDDMLT
ncbi:SSU processome component Utp10, putative [Talaromyces stipitatus ATCC 10500]|uniref:U3 small nucleolar RNA-associated protein 10 n=1 Tax=Talaromyces stipitatus (strain ATCC 10500 / CBS 375.48 / QM 6759 / NRRL 1006) TaxID=441959 RepID=B8LZ63_TALSN|nr:SSU processome component Utp10, putative [Talaromyces stipitatus ATCC 10500]EED21107.1 SSU processome component Utp10, putative [Talaromyces stipitatus ATCC 10500]